MHKILKKISYFIQGIFLFSLFLFLRSISLNLSSKLLGSIAKFIGPKLGISKRAFTNLKNVPGVGSNVLQLLEQIAGNKIINVILKMLKVKKNKIKSHILEPFPHDVPGDWFKGPF